MERSMWSVIHRVDTPGQAKVIDSLGRWVGRMYAVEGGTVRGMPWEERAFKESRRTRAMMRCTTAANP